MTTTLQLKMLGELTIALDGEPVHELRTAKSAALLCYLASTKQPHTRLALAALLWSDDSDDNARNSLRVALAELNKHFPDHLDPARRTVGMATDSPYWTDVDAFEQAVQSIADADAMPNIPQMRAAAALYRGDFLDNLEPDGAELFLTWRNEERERLRQKAQALFERLAHALLKQRAYAEAAPVLERLLSIKPSQEEIHQQLMVTYGRLGQYDAALTQYETCRAILDEALGVKPMPETRALAERLRAAQRAQPHVIPGEEAPFIGRSVELAQLHNMLHNPDCRLITITGLGGIGKTRLALTAAHQANTAQALLFLNGIVFVPLVGVEMPAELPSVLAAALHLTLSGQAPPTTQLLNYLQNKEMLLVLDNFEHLVDGVDLLDQILSACPDVKILVTSREPLYLEAEWRVNLEGLPYPVDIQAEEADFAPSRTVAQANHYEAVRLLLQTAQTIQPDFRLDETTVAPVCRVCELAAGSPLAIKLATLWLRTMPIAQIEREIERNIDMLATELPDWPLRQRSMRAIFDYTYALLTPQEQSTFTELSVFRGGFSEEAAVQVVGATPFVLAGLLDRGLLHLAMTPHGARYTMHELTRQYAADRLDPADRDAVRNEHSDFFAAQVYSHRFSIHARAHQTAIAAIRADLDNIYAAWRWLLERIQQQQDVPNGVMRLAQCIPTLAAYLHFRADYQPAKLFFQHAANILSAAFADSAANGGPDEQHCALLMQLQVRLAWFHLELGEYDDVDRIAADTAPALRAAHQRDDLALLLTIWGRADSRRGAYAAAEERLQESLALFEQSDDISGRAYALSSLAMNASGFGAYERAVALFQQALALYEELGYLPGKALVLCSLGTAYGRQGDHETALKLYYESLTISEAEEYRLLNMANASNIGGSLRGSGQYQQAEPYLQRSLQMAREMNDRRWIAANLQAISLVHVETGDLDAAIRYAREGIAVAHEITSAPDALGCLSVLAHAWAYRGQVENALQALLYVERHPSAMDRDKRYVAELLDELRAELPPALLTSAADWSAQKSLDDILDWVQFTMQ